MENEKDVHSEFGTPSYEASERHRRLKLRQPDLAKGETVVTTIVRILPPMKSYRDRKGVNFAFFRATQWGWTTVDPSNPSRKIYLPFSSTAEKDKDKKYIPGTDPALDKIQAAEKVLKKIEDAAEEQAKAEGTSAADLYKRKKAIAELNPDWQKAKSYTSQYSLKKGWVLAVVDLDGNPTELTLSSKTFFKTKDLIDQIRKGADKTLGAMDPLDINKGCWFKFTTTGNGTSKNDDVSVYKEPLDYNGMTVEAPKSGVLSKEVLERALRLLPDISQDPAYKLTQAEVKELVEGNDDPQRVAKIFKMAWTLDSSTPIPDELAGEDPDYDDAPIS